MRTSDAGLALIKRFEGFSEQAYICPAGYKTIGYGHVVLPHEVFEDVLDEAAAEGLLREDVGAAEYAVMHLIKHALTQSQYDALVSFTFNVGAAALQRSQLRRVVEFGDVQAVCYQWMRWVRGGGRVLKGLVRRREAEIDMYFS
jgi:lysozyme